MKTNTSLSKLLFATTVLSLSVSAFAQLNRSYDRDTIARHNQIRQANRDMNICAELRMDADQLLSSYENRENQMVSAGRSYSDLNSQISNRRSTLRSRNNALNSATSNYSSLKTTQNNKVTIIANANDTLSSATVAIASAKLVKQSRQADKDARCRGLGFGRKCRAAKKALKAAKREVRSLTNTINDANYILRDMSTIDSRVIAAAKTMSQAQRTLAREQNRMPSINSMESDLTVRANTRQSSRESYLIAEEMFVVADMKFVKCKKMKKESRKAPVFREFLVTYSTQGCDGLEQDLRAAKNRPAVRAGILEAHTLVCKSENILCESQLPPAPVMTPEI